MGNMDVMYTRNSDEWETPSWLFDALDCEFLFTLDPCATDQNHKCDQYFTKDDDGLSLPWKKERVFCNPPYGRQIGKWVRKAFEETYARYCPLVVMLLPARTDTKWFHDFIYNKAEVRFMRGRVKFGNCAKDAPFPSMIVIFRGWYES